MREFSPDDSDNQQNQQPITERPGVDGGSKETNVNSEIRQTPSLQESDRSPMVPPETPASSDSTPVTMPETIQNTTIKPSSASKSNRSWTLIGLIILLVIVAVVAAVYWTRSNTSQTKKDIALIREGLNVGSLKEIYPFVQNDDTQTALNNQIFEGLVKYQNGTTIVPDLATSWSNTSTVTWVFNLRHNVTFHDGRTMTASDVRSSLDYAIAHQNSQYNGLAALVAGDISKVDVINPYKVKIITNGPDPILLNQLYGLYIFDSHGKIGSPTSGSGPYTIKPGTKPTTNNIDLVAYDKYWGGHVYTRALDISIYNSDAQILNAFKQGRLNIGGDFTNNQLSELKGPNFHTLTTAAIAVELISLNTVRSGSPLQYLAVRQAMKYAINYNVFPKIINEGGSPFYQLVPPLIPGFDPSLQPISYNPTKAKQLLASVPASVLKQPLTFAYYSLQQNIIEENKVLTSDFRAIGLHIQEEPVTNLNTMLNEINDGQADISTYAYITNTLDGNDIYENVVNNPSLMNNPQISNLISQANIIVDPTKRIQIMQQVAQLVYNYVPEIPIIAHGYNYAYSGPYYLTQSSPNGAAGVYFWQVYQK